MRWRVAIRDVAGNERLFRDVLRALSIEVLDEQGTRFLVNASFDNLETAVEVREEISRLQSIMRETNGDLGFTLGSVFEQRPDGGWREHVIVQLNAGSAVIVGYAGVVRVVSGLSEEDRQRLENERLEGEYQERRREAVARVVSAVHDDRARQVQRLLRGDLNPFTIGHIFDLIQDDMGAAMNDLISKNQQGRLCGSINHPKVFGEAARHIVAKKAPPPNPMTLADAQQCVRDLAARWFERVAVRHDSA